MRRLLTGLSAVARLFDVQSKMRKLARAAGLRRPGWWPARRLEPVRQRDRRDNEHLTLLLSFALEEDANCVDIGANRGDILRQIVERAPSGAHHAFEPLPHLAQELQLRFPQATVHQVALSDARGVARFSHVQGAEARSGLSDREFGASHEIRHFEVATDTLDDVLPETYVPHLIKIDVEGAEVQVLRGANRILREYRPLVWFEHGHRASGFFGADPHEMWDLLCEEHSYRIFDADGRGPLSRDDFFAGTGDLMWTYLART